MLCHVPWWWEQGYGIEVLGEHFKHFKHPPRREWTPKKCFLVPIFKSQVSEVSDFSKKKSEGQATRDLSILPNKLLELGQIFGCIPRFLAIFQGALVHAPLQDLRQNHHGWYSIPESFFYLKTWFLARMQYPLTIHHVSFCYSLTICRSAAKDFQSKCTLILLSMFIHTYTIYTCLTVPKSISFCH